MTPQFIKDYARKAGSTSTSTANQNTPTQSDDSQSTIQVDTGLNPTPSPVPTLIPIPEPPTIRTLTDLEKDELQVYRREQALANTKFEKRQEAMEEMRSIIQHSIEATYLPYTYNCETPYDMLVKLKGVFAPKDHAREQECIEEWDSLTKLKKGTELEAWLLKWETTYVKCKGLNLPETSGRRPIKTFLGAIASISPAFVDNWDNKLVDNPSKAYEFSTVIQRYRDYHRDTKHRTKPRGTHGAFATSAPTAPQFQGRPASDSPGKDSQPKGQTQNQREPPKCRFHDENHFWSDCPYLNKAVRTADWIADKEIMAKVQKKLQEDKLFKAKVEVAIAKRAAYQARTTTKPKPQSKSKGKKGPMAAENTPESVYTIQELSDNKEESEPEHVFITTIV